MFVVQRDIDYLLPNHLTFENRLEETAEYAFVNKRIAVEQTLSVRDFSD